MRTTGGDDTFGEEVLGPLGTSPNGIPTGLEQAIGLLQQVRLIAPDDA